jgi:hypothetical protein
VDPYLQTWDDPISIIQVFGERNHDGRLAPLHNALKARRVEDALRAVGQAHVRLGAPDPHKDHHGDIDFRIQRQINAYNKRYYAARDVASVSIAGMICIAFFFLLRPGEYTGTTSDDTIFRLQNMGLYIRDRKLNLFQCSGAELNAATSVSYTFTTHKNGTRDENIVQGRSGNAMCCPVRATVRRLKHHRLKKSTPSTPSASYYLANRRTSVKPKDVTDTLRHAMRINFHRMGIQATDISARSLRAGGSMAMFFEKIDMNNIRLMGRWHSDDMM